MISKYKGKCYLCGEPTKPNVDYYDMDKKQSYHYQCCVQGSLTELDEELQKSIDLAEKLGYR